MSLLAKGVEWVFNLVLGFCDSFETHLFISAHELSVNEACGVVGARASFH